MRPDVEILDQRDTPLGELVLRRRRVPQLGVEALYEVLLGGAFLMSSLLNDSEIRLATQALARVEAAAPRVLVGGLGLGHTAHAALGHPSLAHLDVVERLGDVIRWHQEGLVPLGRALAGDARVSLVEDDFFGFLARERPPAARYDAVLVDIDHSPRHRLSEEHAGFYGEAGLASLQGALAPGGVFGLWSAEPYEDAFLERLGAVLDDVEVERVVFQNVLVAAEEANWLCFARRPA